MGYYSKEVYERKEAWAEKRMKENAQIDTLTQKQHELLRELCQFRHELHCGKKSAFNEDSADYSYYAREIAEWSVEDGLCEKIEKEFGKKPFVRRYYYTACEVSEILDEEGITFEHEERDKKYDELMSETYNDFEDINKEIETFLYEIDMIHGTKYCPSGMARLGISI